MKVVIVGQGYVGLPLAQGASGAGHSVTGMDLNRDRVAKLNAGLSVIDDISDEDVQAMLSQGYKATSDASAYATADVIVICVPTPLSEGNEPDLASVRAALDAIAANLSDDTLVILESTTYPGTTASEVVPKLQETGRTLGVDLFVAFSPERIDPGNPTYGVKNTPKVVGADEDNSLDRAVAFYETFIDTVVPVKGSAEAELTKLLENTYRHINIGLVNELAMVCHELEIDVWEVIRAASTKPFGYQAFYPGPGVGGHCIPIDPNYLNYRVRHELNHPFRFVELAQDINSSMPAYVVSRGQDLLNNRFKALRGSDVLLIGMTYKSGISDIRESPSLIVAGLLSQKGVNVHYYDPNITDDGIPGLTATHVTGNLGRVENYDLVILLQNVPAIDIEEVAARSQVFLDTRGTTSGSAAYKL
ncbi:nucleotide sugar dehydrogenase [Brevibacterium sp. 50QC2O2]|uniref:nucleotide sugar dehydrogenase n=1 Tax=Brevibacterium sp. 50QC2O2 TaxID=2968459 RepID=UPI00211BDC9C|nr:nucleotide sugar dehydrogenase [Brevibacterium sp. 50QC2O2]